MEGGPHAHRLAVLLDRVRSGQYAGWRSPPGSGHARVDHTPVMHAVTGRRVTEVDVG